MLTRTEIFLGTGAANERRRCNYVTLSLIGQVHTQHDHCSIILSVNDLFKDYEKLQFRPCCFYECKFCSGQLKCFAGLINIPTVKHLCAHWYFMYTMWVVYMTLEDFLKHKIGFHIPYQSAACEGWIPCGFKVSTTTQRPLPHRSILRFRQNQLGCLNNLISTAKR